MHDPIESTHPTVTQLWPRDTEFVAVNHYWNPDDPDTVVIDQLVVDQEYRRRCIGTAMLDALKHIFYAEGAEALRVETSACPGAVPFLKANEFVIESYEEHAFREDTGQVTDVNTHVEARFKLPRGDTDSEDDEHALEATREDR
jgi:GNAT superfamily N-acetyltransferase